jgi:hypothetical protein
MQGAAEIAVRLRESRVGGDCLALRLGRFLVALQLIERDAEVAQRRRHRRLDFERAPRLLDREPGPAGEPIHLAEIGAEQRHLRRKPDRALQMSDRLAYSSILVRHHPEQVFGLRHIRPHLEDLAADRFRFDQPALAAAAFGVHQRFADRHECCSPLPNGLLHALGIVKCSARAARGASSQQAKTSWSARFVSPVRMRTRQDSRSSYKRGRAARPLHAQARRAIEHSNRDRCSRQLHNAR